MALDILTAGKDSTHDAIFSTVGILNTKAITGFNSASASDDSSNIMDIIGFVKALPAGEDVLGLLHQIAPGPLLVDETVKLLKTLPVFTALLPALAPDTTEGELGGDALGAVVGALKSFPMLEGPVSQVITTLHEGPLGEQVGMVTGLLHDISLGGNLLSGTIPAGTLLSSEELPGREGADSLDVVVGFAKSLPVVGDVVSAVIPDVFPLALGNEDVASNLTLPLATLLHNVTPAYQVTNALLGEEGIVTSVLGDVISGDVLDLGSLLGEGDLLGGLLDGALGGLTGGLLGGGDSTGGDAALSIGLLDGALEINIGGSSSLLSFG